MNPNTKKLDGKVAVVTGASKGIGAGIAKHLAAEGAAVVVNYSSSKEGADKVVDEITKRGGKAIAVQADVAKKKDIDRLFAETKKAFGRLDILVNNAGVYEFGPLENVTEEHFYKHFDVNVLGLLLRIAGGVKVFWSGRWKHYQHQFGRQHAHPAEYLGLLSYKSSGRRHNEDAGQGAWAPQHSS